MSNAPDVAGRRGLRVAAALALGGLFTLPVAAHAAGSVSSRAVLKALTVVMADRPATETVVLSRPVTITVAIGGQSPDANVTGRGRMFAIDLMRVPTQSSSQREQIFAAGMNTLGPTSCHVPGCSAQRGTFGLPVQWSMGEGFAHVGSPLTPTPTYALPAGQYKLYVVADGGAMTATLRLHGAPRGVARLRPTGPSSAFVTSVVSSGAPNLYSAGGEHSLNGGGVVMTSTWQSYTLHVSNTMGACYYLSTPPAASPAPPQDTYVTGCPNGDSGVTVNANGVWTDRVPGFGVEVGTYGSAFFDAPLSTPMNVATGMYSDGVYLPDYSSPTDLMWLPLSR